MLTRLFTNPIYSIQTVQEISKPLEEVFSFFNQPENLEQLTPASLNFKILTPSPVPMKKGIHIDYEIRLFGFPLHWKSLISDYDAPRRFVDTQIRGPYASWVHEHLFEKSERGTKMTDTVHYQLRGGLVGRLIHVIFVRRELIRIFHYRKVAVRKLFS